MPFCEGWRPVVYGTPTLTQWPVLFCFPVSGVVSFCEGWRPVVYGTPTLTEWPVPFCFLFLVLCHSVWVGVPLFTGRQPSQNGQCHFLFFLILALCHSVWVGVPLLTGHQPSQNGQRLLFFCFSCFSPSSCLISRPSEKSRMRCPDQGGRESWDWAEQKSLYEKNSPHKVGEESFV